MLYMYTNMEEVESYFGKFEKTYWTSHNQPTLKQLDHMCEHGLKVVSDGEIRSELSTCSHNKSGVVTSGEDATGHIIEYYGIIQTIVEYTFSGAKELKVVFF
jgi:hypothetical protein